MDVPAAAHRSFGTQRVNLKFWDFIFKRGSGALLSGTVKWFYATKGYGFFQPDLSLVLLNGRNCRIQNCILQQPSLFPRGGLQSKTSCLNESRLKLNIRSKRVFVELIELLLELRQSFQFTFMKSSRLSCGDLPRRKSGIPSELSR
jgi:hypothetical protein